MFTNGIIAESFYFLRNNEKRVAELHFIDNCFTLVNERELNGYVNAEFVELEKALKKLVKLNSESEMQAIYDDTKNAIDNSTDVLLTLRDVAIQNLPSYSLFLNEQGNYRVQRSTPLKLVDLSIVDSHIKFDDVINSVINYDNGTISGKKLQENVQKWYSDNGFNIELSGKRIYNLKHCISVSLNVKKQKISSNVKNAMIAYIAICPETVF